MEYWESCFIGTGIRADQESQLGLTGAHIDSNIHQRASGEAGPWWRSSVYGKGVSLPVSFDKAGSMSAFIDGKPSEPISIR